jgi:hypothetical protein
MAFDPISLNEIKKIKNELNSIKSKIKLEKYNGGVKKIAVLDENNNLLYVDKDKLKYDLDIVDMVQVLKYVDFLNEKIDILNGIDSKTIGYLYGGYKGGVSIDHIQRYDTIQEISKDIYTTGKKVAYVPGITTSKNGYFTWSSDRRTWYWSTFDFSSETLGAQLTATLPTRIQVSAYNMGNGDKALVSSGSQQNGSSAFQPIQHVAKTWIFNPDTLTFTEIPNNTLNNIRHTTRQALNNDAAAFIISLDESPSNHYIYTWNTQTVSTDSSHKFSRCQISVGLSKDKSKGYWIDKVCAGRVTYDGNSILASASIPYTFSYHFGESHSLQNYKSGFVMAGYDDNIGEFGGGQHGYVSKMDWATETTYSLPKLAFPQSSGEMVQH